MERARRAGLYLGIPLPERHDYAGVLPDKKDPDAVVSMNNDMLIQQVWFGQNAGQPQMHSCLLKDVALAFLITFGLWLSRREPLDRVLHPRLFHAYGKLFFAFVMLWAYFSFSQFLIIWSANIPEEIPHYLNRWENSWKFLSIFIVVGHFMVPYALLLSRDLKRNYRKLQVIAAWRNRPATIGAVDDEYVEAGATVDPDEPTSPDPDRPVRRTPGDCRSRSQVRWRSPSWFPVRAVNRRRSPPRRRRTSGPSS